MWSARAFIDTSALFAGVRSQTGYARELLYAGGERRVELWASLVVVNEARRNLTAKGSGIDLAYLDDLLALGVFRLITPSTTLIAKVARDIEFKDAPIVAAAITAETPMLATFDRKHLLSRADDIRSLFGISVMTPEEVVLSLPPND